MAAFDIKTLPNNLNGQVVAVTGALRGIGRAIAIKLAELGANIVVTYGSTGSAAEVVAAIEALGNGAQAIAIQADVSSVADAGRLADETVKVFGRLDVLVNNAGVLRPGLTDKLPLNQFGRLLRTNVPSTYYVSRAAFGILQDGGAVISISSVATKTRDPSYPITAYTAAKGFIEALTRGLAAELSPSGSRIYVVSPGYTLTDMLAVNSNEVTRGGEQKPLFKPEDVAEAVAFLAVPRSSAWSTNQKLVVT
ncbi:hypothetical protein HK105_200417 [Polyrhizophydium stewartii]|uniref:Ketoreductase domain-containing protein n=1 Tax=Polyrhizophydium stewartii TaxID=2732419 RepID=A0ABR4NLM4_9FUNG